MIGGVINLIVSIFIEDDRWFRLNVIIILFYIVTHL